MKRLNLEIAVGFFLLLGLVSFSYLVIKLGDARLLETGVYPVTARFESSAGLSKGANVEIAGVKVGKVVNIELDPKTYRSVVTLTIDDGIELQEDSIASVRSTGLIGDKVLAIAPGGSDELLGPNGVIIETESSVSIEELISKYIFQSK